MLIFNLHCQLALRISGNMQHKNTLKCKIPIVPEEGWFGQPKYNTPSKKILRCLGFYLYILHYLSSGGFSAKDSKI